MFTSSTFDAPIKGGGLLVRIFPCCLVWKKLEWCGYPTVKTVLRYVHSFDRMHESDRHTDSRTDRQTDSA